MSSSIAACKKRPSRAVHLHVKTPARDIGRISRLLGVVRTPPSKNDAQRAGSRRGGAWQAHSPGACDASPPPPRASARRPGPSRSGAGAACWRSGPRPAASAAALTSPAGGAIHGRAGNGGSSHFCARSASGTSMGKGEGSQASPSRRNLATLLSLDRNSAPRERLSRPKSPSLPCEPVLANTSYCRLCEPQSAISSPARSRRPARIRAVTVAESGLNPCARSRLDIIASLERRHLPRAC